VASVAGRRVALAVPTTYMNESGLAVRGLATRFGIDDPATIVVVHDELDLAPGTVRLKAGGGLAGHNGLRSIAAHLHTNDFLRVRIGVGKPPSAAQGASHVLRRPPKAVREVLHVALETAADSVERIAADGIDAAMLWCHSLPAP
jgi:PTH1 family peptidyl-tRNA hydrolase